MDAVASLYGRNCLTEIVGRTAREIFIPLTVGGGLKSLDDIRTVLRAGADKVSINTAAVKRADLIREASQAFGPSTIVVSIEAIRQPDGSYEALTDYGREKLRRLDYTRTTHSSQNPAHVAIRAGNRYVQRLSFVPRDLSLSRNHVSELRES
jgi:imidazole glycerol phosphate synthase subunit HisF